MLDRRKFLQLSGTALTAAISLDITGCSTTKKRAWGVQLFSIPKMAAADFAGTLKKLSVLGYQQIEFFGPYSFSAQTAIDKWKPLADRIGISKTGLYGFQVTEVKKMLADNGLSVPSAHLDLSTMRTNLNEASKNLSALGVNYITLPLIADEPMNSAEEFYRLAEEFNNIGKQMREHGATFVYHNHGYEHNTKDGQIPMDILLSNTDPELVKFELDIFWMQAAGANPVEYLKKYPSRFKLMHVKDASEAVRFSGDGSTPNQWMELFPKMADPGSGVFDIRSIVEAGIQSGVDHFFLEYDLTSNPDATLKNSIEYFRKLG